MSKTKVGIISDTHGILREEVIMNLQGCDYIIHAGDIGKEEILSQLREIAKIIVVRGNNDKDEWSNSVNRSEKINIAGVNIYIVHDKKDIPRYLNDIDLIVFGHSHKYFDETVGDIRFFNPGSCGRKRFSLPLTMAICTIDNSKVYIEKIEI